MWCRLPRCLLLAFAFYLEHVGPENCGCIDARRSTVFPNSILGVHFGLCAFFLEHVGPQGCGCDARRFGIQSLRVQLAVDFGLCRF